MTDPQKGPNPWVLAEAEYQSLLARLRHDMFKPPTVRAVDLYGLYRKHAAHWLPAPSYGTPGSAGMDLRWCGKEIVKKAGEDTVVDHGPSGILLPPGDRRFLCTGLKMQAVEEDVHTLLVPRSSLGARGIVLSNLVGVIDNDYQGEWIMVIWNASSNPVTIKGGERLCQALFIHRGGIIRPDVVLVEDLGEETTRGQGGFNSTGTN